MWLKKFFILAVETTGVSFLSRPPSCVITAMTPDISMDGGGKAMDNVLVRAAVMIQVVYHRQIILRGDCVRNRKTYDDCSIGSPCHCGDVNSAL